MSGLLCPSPCSAARLTLICLSCRVRSLDNTADFTLKLKSGRHNPPSVQSFVPLLQSELEALRQQATSEMAATDNALAASINREQYEATGQLIECACCFDKASFEKMVQCQDVRLNTPPDQRYLLGSAHGSLPTAVEGKGSAGVANVYETASDWLAGPFVLLRVRSALCQRSGVWRRKLTDQVHGQQWLRLFIPKG